MTLTLQVSGSQGEKLGPAGRKEFREDGGTIGREVANHWVLPSKFVSAHHASIRFRQGVFYVEDTSTHGVFINSPEQRVARPQPLASGDSLFIKPYKIEVSVSGAAGLDAPARPYDRGVEKGRDFSDPFGLDDPFLQPTGPPRGPRGSSVVASDPSPYPATTAEDVVDPLELIGIAVEKRPSSARGVRAEDLAAGSLLTDHYQPPPVSAPERPVTTRPDLIPDDYDVMSDDFLASSWAPSGEHPARPLPVPGPRPDEKPPVASPGPESTTVSDTMWQSIMAGAGLDDVAATPELARTYGQILRVVVTGVMDVLQARQQVRDEFRMRRTRFKERENNPLKFSENADTALRKLLGSRLATYTGPVEAFEEAFDDLRAHQIAMLAGVRAAFDALLEEFDPDRLQEQFDRQLKKGSVMDITAKLRYWELYRGKVQGLLKDVDTSYRKLFGEKFVNAYEEQLKQLNAHRPGAAIGADNPGPPRDR